MRIKFFPKDSPSTAIQIEVLPNSSRLSPDRPAAGEMQFRRSGYRLVDNVITMTPQWGYLNMDDAPSEYTVYWAELPKWNSEYKPGAKYPLDMDIWSKTKETRIGTLTEYLGLNPKKQYAADAQCHAYARSITGKPFDPNEARLFWIEADHGPLVLHDVYTDEQEDSELEPLVINQFYNIVDCKSHAVKVPMMHLDPDNIHWLQRINVTVNLKSRKPMFSDVETFSYIALVHQFVEITQSRLIVQQKPVRYFLEMDKSTAAHASHYPVAWDAALDDIRTIELRKMTEYAGSHFKRNTIQGGVIFDGKLMPSMGSRRHNYTTMKEFYANLGLVFTVDNFNTSNGPFYFYDYDDFYVLYAFLKDGSRKVIWTYAGFADPGLQTQATITEAIEKARKAKTASEAVEEERRDYL